MQGTNSLTGLLLAGVRWAIPWTSVLLVSGVLAYGMNAAIAGGRFSETGPPNQGSVASVHAELSAEEGRIHGSADSNADLRSTTSPFAVSADSGHPRVARPCAAIGGGAMYAGVDWWIVAESQKIACEPVTP
jgi:hypothetical protein